MNTNQNSLVMIALLLSPERKAQPGVTPCTYDGWQTSRFDGFTTTQYRNTAARFQVNTPRDSNGRHCVFFLFRFLARWTLCTYRHLLLLLCSHVLFIISFSLFLLLPLSHISPIYFYIIIWCSIPFHLPKSHLALKIQTWYWHNVQLV